MKHINNTPPAKGFGSKIGFIAATTGSAIGLGNIWRFPYEVGQNGGATFLLIYFICVLLLGYPLIVAELSFGRSIGGSFLTAAKKYHAKWCSSMAVFTIVCGILLLSFYNLITGWTVGYFVELLRGTLLEAEDTALFFSNFSQDGALNAWYSLVVLLPVAWLIQQGVQDGIERWSKILMPLFLLMLLALIGYALTLQGAWQGLSFYLLPHFTSITPAVIYQALAQSFLSLSVGLGIMVTYGSYMNGQAYIPHSAAVIALSDTVVSFLTGLFIFPFIYYKQIPVNQGSSLVFVSLPLVFQTFGPLTGRIIGSAFFLLFAFAAITSSMSLLEVITTYMAERLRIKRGSAAYLSAAVVYIMSIPSMLSMGGSQFFTSLISYQGRTESFFSFISYLMIEVILPLSCLLFIILFSHMFKREQIFLEISKYRSKPTRSWLEDYIYITLRYVCPVILSFIVLMNTWKAV